MPRLPPGSTFRLTPSPISTGGWARSTTRSRKPPSAAGQQQHFTAIETQRRARAELAGQRLKTERATVAAKGKAVASEAAPIQYVAAVFGVPIRRRQSWLILMMVLCCDPLAIAPHGRCGWARIVPTRALRRRPASSPRNLNVAKTDIYQNAVPDGRPSPGAGGALGLADQERGTARVGTLEGCSTRRKQPRWPRARP
jgi:hypothetical protein